MCMCVSMDGWMYIRVCMYVITYLFTYLFIYVCNRTGQGTARHDTTQYNMVENSTIQLYDTTSVLEQRM